MWREKVELFLWKLNSGLSDVNLSGWLSPDGLKLFFCYFLNNLSPRKGYKLHFNSAEITTSHPTKMRSKSSLLTTDSGMN